MSAAFTKLNLDEDEDTLDDTDKDDESKADISDSDSEDGSIGLVVKAQSTPLPPPRFHQNFT
ncbi:hypothetical protein CROQUDRAFT_87993 [Cronartium quercuum f. sp. fusiforme G11]|uniref:Uncharacterized protein n=1 Tax=Cronartium quercuum f. sp. fusiforme G11 TaxID=708437 RepID=A0A9P6NVV9_9BASI|nr:hypothetical protein CROQUDRAFT_87993 [Cronartium quercuum f. sp. fusiforme G11]